MKHLKFDKPTPDLSHPALEGFAEGFLKKLGGLFKSKSKKLELQQMPYYESELKKLKAAIMNNYGTLEAVRQFTLLAPGQTVSPHNVAPYLGIDELQPTPFDTHKHVQEAVKQLMSWRPHLETAVNHFFTQGNAILMRGETGGLDKTLFDEMDRDIIALGHKFTMPPIPNPPLFHNLVKTNTLRGAFDPTQGDWMTSYAVLTPDALHKSLRDALPVLTHEQIVDFGHAMIEILNFLIWEVAQDFKPLPPYLPDEEPPKLYAFLEETGMEGGMVSNYSNCFYQGHFIPDSVWCELCGYMGDCLLAMDRWISRSIR